MLHAKFLDRGKDIDFERNKSHATRYCHQKSFAFSHRRVGMMDTCDTIHRLNKCDGCFYVNFIYKKEINVQV